MLAQASSGPACLVFSGSGERPMAARQQSPAAPIPVAVAISRDLPLSPQTPGPPANCHE